MNIRTGAQHAASGSLAAGTLVDDSPAAMPRQAASGYGGKSQYTVSREPVRKCAVARTFHALTLSRSPLTVSRLTLHTKHA